MTDGCSSYRFPRGDMRECRVFVEQSAGVISCREAPPVNTRYRRVISIRGLQDATVRLFSEKECEAIVSVSRYTDDTPVPDERFRWCQDEIHGDFLLGEHIDGDIFFRIGHHGTQKS